MASTEAWLRRDRRKRNYGHRHAFAEVMLLVRVGLVVASGSNDE
jgi:hypothetical protein